MVQFFTWGVNILGHNCLMTTNTLSSLLASTTSATTLLGLSGTAGPSASSLLASNPGLKTLATQISSDQTRLSNIGKVALALDDFKTIAGNLSAGGLAQTVSASTTAVTATLAAATSTTGTTTSATAGTHAVVVQQLAQGQQLTGTTLASHTAALGTGAATTIKVTTGTGSDAKTTLLSIDSSNNSLDGIAQAMQDAGIDAKVTQTAKGYALTINGQAGAANTMTISVSGDAALQGLLTYKGSGKSAMTQTAAAQDAQLTVDGKAVTSTSNKVDGAIAGVSLTLTATGKSDVKVSSHSTGIAANVKNFVNAYNTLNTQLTSLKASGGANATTIAQIQSQLANTLSGADSTALASMGITRKNGTLALDETKLNAAVAANPDAITKTFSNGGSGLADQMTTRVAQQMATGGMLAKQSAAVQKDMNQLTDKQTKLTAVVNNQAAALAQQYASLSATSSSLTSMLGGSGMSLFDYIV